MLLLMIVVDGVDVVDVVDGVDVIDVVDGNGVVDVVVDAFVDVVTCFRSCFDWCC